MGLWVSATSKFATYAFRSKVIAAQSFNQTERGAWECASNMVLVVRFRNLYYCPTNNTGVRYIHVERVVQASGYLGGITEVEVYTGGERDVRCMHARAHYIIYWCLHMPCNVSTNAALVAAPCQIWPIMAQPQHNISFHVRHSNANIPVCRPTHALLSKVCILPAYISMLACSVRAGVRCIRWCNRAR